MCRFPTFRCEKAKEGTDEPHGGQADTLSHLPEAHALEDGANPFGEREALRSEIRDLALRALANNELNAGAFRALAEVTSRVDQVRLLMQEALGHSRHEFGRSVLAP